MGAPSTKLLLQQGSALDAMHVQAQVFYCKYLLLTDLQFYSLKDSMYSKPDIKKHFLVKKSL